MTSSEKQAILLVCGCDVKVDGQWGAQSVAAARALQEDAGITADGVFGPGTERAAREYVGAGRRIAKKATAAAPTGTGTGLFGSKYFTKEEFRCRCGGRYCSGYPADVSPVLIRMADRVREHFGRPMVLTSGLRCERWNADPSVGGAAGSRHTRGTAMDFYIPGVDGQTLVTYVRQQPECNYTYRIQGGDCIHMDVV